jgi:hypothetical protein
MRGVMDLRKFYIKWPSGDLIRMILRRTDCQPVKVVRRDTLQSQKEFVRDFSNSFRVSKWKAKSGEAVNATMIKAVGRFNRRRSKCPERASAKRRKP